jgi:ribonuclease HI
MIEKRLRDKIKLSPVQFGCRAGHSTSHALARLLHASGLAAAAHKQFGCISFDFSKAYDRVPRNLLVHKLAKQGIPPYLTLVINDWLTERSFYVTHRGATSEVHHTSNGIPQGSSLSVILWLVFINDIEIEDITTNLFVDDTIIWASGETREEVKLNLKNKATKILNWCQSNKVKINFDKTKLVFNETDPDDEDLVLPLGTITSAHTLKYLGTIFKSNKPDSNSTFLIDLESIGADLRRRCSILKKLRKYRIPQPLMERFVEGFVCGKLRFYAPFLGAETHHPVLLKPLQLAYNEIMRTELGAVKTTPLPLLQAGTRRPSLTNLIATSAATMIKSSIANNNILGKEYLSWDGTFDGWSPYGKAWELLRSATPDFKAISAKSQIPSNILEKIYRCSFRIPATIKEALKLQSEGSLLIDSDIQLWTDGSFVSSREQGRAAYIIAKNGNDIDSHVIGLKPITSSYEAELAALSFGLRAMRLTAPSHSRIVIYTDSQGLARQLESLPLSYKTVDKLLLDCANELSQLTEYNQVTICWIPGHQDIGRNQDVDELTRSELLPVEDLVEIEPRLCSYKLRFKKDVFHKTELEIRQHVKPSHFLSYPDRTMFIGYELQVNGLTKWVKSPYTRKSQNIRGALFRVRSGHTRCLAHFRRLGIVEAASTCRLCEEENVEETVDHMLFECSALQTHLGQHIIALANKTADRELDINRLCWSHPKEVQNLLTAAVSAGAWI